MRGTPPTPPRTPPEASERALLYAIAIQINSIEVVYYILTNHLTLHMTCFGSIGSNECTLVIAA